MTQNAMIERAWEKSPLKDEEQVAIQERVREIGRRLQNSSEIYKMASLAVQRSRYSVSLTNSDRMQSLALGPLGLTLFFEEMDRALPGEGWDDIAQSYFAQALEYVPQNEPASFGLFSGASGLLFTAVHLSRSGTRSPESYQRFASSVFSSMDKYFIPNDAPRPETFALTSGVVGIGTALLTLAEQPSSKATAQARRYLERLVHHLSWLALRNKDETIGQFINWYPNSYLQEAQARWLPETAFHGSGMRQGLAGLISFLSLMMDSDLDINGDEVADVLDLLCTRVCDEIAANGQSWQLPQEMEGDHYHRPGACAPFAWCNGISGIARALWLAGRALGDEDFTAFAQDGLRQAISNFKEDPRRVGPSLCHGVAGLLQVSTRFARDTEDLDLTEDIQAMVQRILELFEPDRPFGYRSFEPEYIRVDSPWLLDGASGVAMALLSLLNPVAPTWDRILLLG